MHSAMTDGVASRRRTADSAAADGVMAENGRWASGIGPADGRQRLPPGAAGRQGGLGRASLVANDGLAAGEASQARPQQQGQAPAGAPLVEPTVRTNFADTAKWIGSLTTDKTGIAEVEIDMPENLTAWKIKVWAHGPRHARSAAAKPMSSRART